MVISNYPSYMNNTYKGMNTEYDTTSNIVSGYGLSTQWGTLEVLYRDSWACRRIIDFYPMKMIKGWGTLTLETGNEKLQQKINKELRKLSKKYCEGQKLGNLHGDGYVIRLIDDGRELHEPVNIEAIKSIKYSRLFDHNDISPYIHVENYGEDYYNPEVFYFYTSTEEYKNSKALVHRDRLIRFIGDSLPPKQYEQNNYRSASILEGIIVPYTRLNQTLHHIAEGLTEFEIIAMGIEGLMDDIIAGGAQSLTDIKNRYKMFKKDLSSMRIAVHDKDREEIKVIARQFPNVSNLIERVFVNELVAASRLTKTQLYNEHPKGMNSTGKSELLEEANRVMELQEYKWREDIEYDIELMLAVANYQGEWSWAWDSIYQPTRIEELEIKESIAKSDKMYYETGALTSEDIRQRFIGTEFTEDLTVDDVELPDSVDEKQTEEVETDTESSENEKKLENSSTKNDAVEKFYPDGNVLMNSEYVPLDLDSLVDVDDDDDE